MGRPGGPAAESAAVYDEDLGVFRLSNGTTETLEELGQHVGPRGETADIHQGWRR